MTENLTTDQIEEILSFFDEWYQTLPPVLRDHLLARLKDPLRKGLSKVKIYPQLISDLRSELARAYRYPEPGKAVGIITGQVTGEMTTQDNLNRFHFAGFFEKSSISGVSRFYELIYTGKSTTQSSRTCTIELLPPYNQQPREDIISKIKYTTFGDCLRGYDESSTDALEWEQDYWEYHQTTTGDEFQKQPRVVLNFNEETLFRLKISLQEIIQALKLDESVVVAYSPLHMAQAVVYQDPKTVGKWLSLPIGGIPGIHQARFFPKKDGTWYIHTEGSNLLQILSLPFVDSWRTVTSDFWEVYNLWGIEGVRAMYMEEFSRIMPRSDSSHISLLVDRMTVSGKLKSITRYTRKTEESSVLSKITFEETLQGFTRACFAEKVDPIRGCSASVICGKRLCIGSGMNELFLQGEVEEDTQEHDYQE